MLRWPPAARSTRFPGHRERSDFRHGLAFAALLSALLHLALLRGLAPSRSPRCLLGALPRRSPRSRWPRPKTSPAPRRPRRPKPSSNPEARSPRQTRAPPRRASEPEKDANGWVQSQRGALDEGAFSGQSTQPQDRSRALSRPCSRRPGCNNYAILRRSCRSTAATPNARSTSSSPTPTEPAVGATGASLIAHGAAFFTAQENRRGLRLRMPVGGKPARRRAPEVQDWRPDPGGPMGRLLQFGPKSPAPLGDD